MIWSNGSQQQIKYMYFSLIGNRYEISRIWESGRFKMAPEEGDWAKRWMFICLLLMCLTSDKVFGLIIDRDKLLEIRSTVINVGYKPTFLNNLDISIPTGHSHSDSTDVPKRSTRKRGWRAGVLVRLRHCGHRPPLPVVMLGNVRSLFNKKDEFSALVKFNREFKDCSAFCFSETWLNPDIPNCAVVQPGFALFDRIPEQCHNSRGGGVCFMVNQRWCTDTTLLSSHCSPDLESLIVKCRPFYVV